MPKEKDVEVSETKALVVSAPSFLGDDDYDAGFETADKDAYAIPFIQVLQKMSPAVDEDNPKYIKDAKPGMFLNTVSQRLYDGKDGILIVPCYFKRSFILWGARANGGGFKGEFTPEDMAAMEKDPTLVKTVDGKMFKPDEDGSVNEKKSDHYSDTRSHYILLLDEKTGTVEQAILSLSSTQVKASKMFMTSLRQRKVDRGGQKATPPMYANVARVTTVGEANDKGTWSGVRFELEGLIKDADLFMEAKSFHHGVSSGALKADYSKSPSAEAGGVEDEPTVAEGF